MNHKVIFAGAGAGAPDLLTLRCARALECADLVIYAGSLVNPEVLHLCPVACRLIDSAKLDLDEVIELIREAVAQKQSVVRLHTGDPAMYGAISEQMNRLDELDIDFEVIPGVSSIFAAAAELKCELTMPGISQSLILTRTTGRTPMPERETVANFAATGATLAFFLSAGKLETLTSELLEAGLAAETPAAVVYRASWPNQKIVRGTLADLAEKTTAAGINRQALVLVGRVLERSGNLSLLYDKHFSHGYRSRREDEFFAGDIALYAMSEEGYAKSQEIAAGLDAATIFVPERLVKTGDTTQSFAPGQLGHLLEENWNQFAGHIFIAAAGIAVRKVAPLLKHKTVDPAVVVCDENGAQIISLVGGHIAGANRLARKVAAITGGQAIITTATDTRGLVAFDELAARQGWQIKNPQNIKIFNAALLDNKKINLLLPEEIFQHHYLDKGNLTRVSTVVEIKDGLAVVLDPPVGWQPPKATELLLLNSEST